jgi:hypothetical protein
VVRAAAVIRERHRHHQKNIEAVSRVIIHYVSLDVVGVGGYQRMVLKKLLGFATTTSLILLVMVAPTTTSLQQEDNVTTTDEPDIPTGPADEDEPDEPIPDNENETDDDGDDDGGGGSSGGGAGDGNVTVVCPAVLKAMFEPDKKTYKQGEDATVRGQFSAMRGDEDYNMPVEVTYTSPSGKEYAPNNVWPEYSGGDRGYLNFHFTIEIVGTRNVEGVCSLPATSPRYGHAV